MGTCGLGKEIRDRQRCTVFFFPSFTSGAFKVEMSLLAVQVDSRDGNLSSDFNYVFIALYSDKPCPFPQYISNFGVCFLLAF
jgi:hypothetical protein